MVMTVAERDNTIQLFLNLRRSVDNITFPTLNLANELKHIEEKILEALDEVENAKEELRMSIENQKNILLNTPVEMPKEKKKGLFGRWK